MSATVFNHPRQEKPPPLYLFNYPRPGEIHLVVPHKILPSTTIKFSPMKRSNISPVLPVKLLALMVDETRV